MKPLVLASLAGLSAAMAFSAAAQPPPQSGQCFWIRDLRNHTVGDDHTLYFDVGGRAVYRATTSGACLAGATSTDPIVLRNRPATGQICNRLDLDVSVRGARCIISELTRLTPEEAAALPRRVRP